MRSRDAITDSFKSIVIPSSRDDLKLQIELLLDIRELLSGLLKLAESEARIKRVRKARQRVIAKRMGK